MRSTGSASRRCLVLGVLVTMLAGQLSAQAKSWPMYRAGPARTASTQARLSAKMELKWCHAPRLAPKRAWPRLTRMTFDRAHHAVVAEGLVFYGRSADGMVVALDLETGRERWNFPTGGPVRFAPAIAKGRVCVGSDDGWLYCLDATDGHVLWKKRGRPDPRQVLGNGQMISRWPVRGGPAIRDDVVYFAAGIWPSDGIYIHALDLETGRRIWTNDDSGGIFMPQPHGGAQAESGISAQGHLVVSDEYVIVPTGRAVPAAFSRSDGKFLYYHLQKNGSRGGTATMASGKFFFNSGMFFDVKSGAARGNNPYLDIAARGDDLVTVGKIGVSLHEWKAVEKEEKGKRVRQWSFVTAFSLERPIRDECVIVAGDHMVTGSADGVTLVGIGDRKQSWSASIDGTVLGLAAVDGHVLASTDTGAIYCFGVDVARAAGAKPRPVAIEQTTPVAPAFEKAADEILKRTGVREGWCLDMECGDGSLACELARKSDLRIVAITSDPALARSARARCIAAGLYGDRIMVHESPPGATAYPPYFADLIVSGASVLGGADVVDAAAAARVQRPCGGVVCVGRSGALRVNVRGALPGAGDWTHQYADAGNSACSDDTVSTPLVPLWFDDLGQALTQRHGRGPSPLYLNGRVFSLGLHSLVAIDAYNGRKLWEFPLPGILEAYDGDHLMGTAGTHSPYCVAPHGVYVRRAGTCLRIDPVTGRELATFRAPRTAEGKPGIWGFIACEGGRLFGGLANPEHVVTYRYQHGGNMAEQLTESSTLFAMDAESGELLWRYDAADSIRHNAIASGDGAVYLVDRSLALFDRERATPAGEHPAGTLRALDAASGKELWHRQGVLGTTLSLSTSHESLVVAYQPTRFQLASEVGGSLLVLDTSNGQQRWQNEASYQSRIVINDRTVYAQGGAWDLLSGEKQTFEFSRSYGCGILAGGRNLFVYRSATLGYFDLNGSRKNEDFGGIRPGCWINALPAGGLVLVPDGSTGCKCSYQNKTWIALRPDDR